jgi:hypothetical protein
MATRVLMSPFRQITTSLLERLLAFIRTLLDRYRRAMLLQALLHSVSEIGCARAGLTSEELT